MSRIRSDHVAFLVGALESIGATERERLKVEVLNGQASGRRQALELLDAAQAGTHARLDQIWTAYGRQSLFLWELPIVASANLVGMVQSAIGRTRQETLGETWIKFEAPSGAEVTDGVEDDEDDDVVSDEPTEAVAPRVLRVRKVQDVIQVTMRLTRYMRYVYEDVERKRPVQQDVGLSIEVISGRPVARVYSAQQQSRKSVRSFLAWLLNRDLPKNNPALGRYMAPVKFTEAHVKALATNLSLDHVGMSGPDSQGVLGELSMKGKAQGFYKAEPLDLTDERVRDQDAIPQDSHAYNWDFEHDDGFVEEGRVLFVLDARHPYISFLVRTSQPAMADAANKLYSLVRSMP